jgi:8-oxo-dGTP pyrophosphatase MutT (NUDIX family)
MPESEPQPWDTLASRTLLDRPPWLRLREDRVRLPTGAVLETYYILEYADWACVVPVTREGEVVMVEQWRHAIGRVSLEFPAGAVDGGEAPEDAARRELAEEAGVTAGALEPLARLATEPARHTNWAHVYLARDAEITREPAPDDSEDLVVRRVPIGALAGLVAEGEIVHGVHAAAAMLALARMQG